MQSFCMQSWSPDGHSRGGLQLSNSSSQLHPLQTASAFFRSPASSFILTSNYGTRGGINYHQNNYYLSFLGELLSRRCDSIRLKNPMQTSRNIRFLIFIKHVTPHGDRSLVFQQQTGSSFEQTVEPNRKHHPVSDS
jgi:hypothetical protein